jgi:hypothetical protein
MLNNDWKQTDDSVLKLKSEEKRQACVDWIQLAHIIFIRRESLVTSLLQKCLQGTYFQKLYIKEQSDVLLNNSAADFINNPLYGQI